MNDDPTADGILREVERTLRIADVREMLLRFRRDPIGGRLASVKRVFYWFNASAFDRQAKILDAMLDLIDDLKAEVERGTLGQGRS